MLVFSHTISFCILLLFWSIFFYGFRYLFSILQLCVILLLLFSLYIFFLNVNSLFLFFILNLSPTQYLLNIPLIPQFSFLFFHKQFYIFEIGGRWTSSKPCIVLARLAWPCGPHFIFFKILILNSAVRFKFFFFMFQLFFLNPTHLFASFCLSFVI